MLFDSVHLEWNKLNKALEGLTDEQKLQQGACGAWSIKDILAHLVDLRSALRVPLGQFVDPGLRQTYLSRSVARWIFQQMIHKGVYQ